jgi:magnesium-transporting ATPase (P-type)
MQDELRNEANDAIKVLKYGSNTTIVDNNGEVNVRILTGDHIETAKQVALRCGIIMQEDIN